MADKQILKNSEILNHVKINGENTINCFIKIKECKNNFAKNSQVRLINPAKNKLGSISEVILDKSNILVLTNGKTPRRLLIGSTNFQIKRFIICSFWHQKDLSIN